MIQDPGLLAKVWNGVLLTPFWEWVGVVTSVAYVILAAKRSIACWIFALISSACYVYLCFSAKLYIETMLQVFYFGMGILGWILWYRPQPAEQEIQTWGLRYNLLNILLSGLLTGILGFIFSRYTNQASPYMDAFVTSFCLSATLMITKKVHEGWIYLIVIDFVSIFLYAGRDLYLSSLLYIMYTLIAVFGWIEWYRKFRDRRLETGNQKF